MRKERLENLTFSRHFESKWDMTDANNLSDEVVQMVWRTGITKSYKGQEVVGSYD